MQCQNESFHVFGGLNESSAKLSHAARIPQPSMKESSSHEFHEPGIRSQELSAMGLRQWMTPAGILSRAACMLLFPAATVDMIYSPQSTKMLPRPPLPLECKVEARTQNPERKLAPQKTECNIAFLEEGR